MGKTANTLTRVTQMIIDNCQLRLTNLMSIYLKKKTIIILHYKEFDKKLHKISSIKCNIMISTPP